MELAGDRTSFRNGCRRRFCY